MVVPKCQPRPQFVELSEKRLSKDPLQPPEKGLSFLKESLESGLFKEFLEIKSKGKIKEKVNCLFCKTK